MASEMDKIMDMSLDEIIARKKGFAAVSNDTGLDSSSGECSFKAERRKQKRAEEAEDDEDADVLDLDLGDEAVQTASGSKADVTSSKMFGIWRGPSATTSYLDLDYMKDEFDNMFNDPELQVERTSAGNQTQPQKQNVDLRNRLGGSSSQQWRLARPPIVPPADLSQSNCEISDCMPDGQNRRRWNRRQRRRNGNGGGNFWAGGNGNWNSGRQFSGCNPNFNHNQNNNGRIQRYNQRNNCSHDLLNKNIKAVLERINSNNFVTNRPLGGVRDLTIECPSAAINLNTDPLPKPFQSAAMQCSPATQPSSSQGLKALLGVSDNSFKTEMMPVLASKFLDFLQNGAQPTIHKPIYDMQVQKEIHELQKKPLLYKCPGGEVVSSDGAGIESCQIIPRSSGVTLNYRFG